MNRLDLPRVRVGFLLLMAALGAACGTGARKPGGSADPGSSGNIAVDVRFMRGMIAHHAQALAMAGLVPDRAGSESIRRLARRIEVSQKDEIALMERWLAGRGETLAEGHHHGPVMPGMLTEEELTRLAGTTGDEFDRLFLEYMIRHHEGALVMVAELFASGGGQDAATFRFVSDVDADQRAELARMRRMLSTPTEEDNE